MPVSKENSYLGVGDHVNMLDCRSLDGRFRLDSRNLDRHLFLAAAGVVRAMALCGGLFGRHVGGHDAYCQLMAVLQQAEAEEGQIVVVKEDGQEKR